ncbi:MAG: hypothetical protein ACKESC_00465 [Candidatus Hodgkinia cicadicola]
MKKRLLNEINLPRLNGNLPKYIKLLLVININNVDVNSSVVLCWVYSFPSVFYKFILFKKTCSVGPAGLLLELYATSAVFTNK